MPSMFSTLSGSIADFHYAISIFSLADILATSFHAEGHVDSASDTPDIFYIFAIDIDDIDTG